MHDQYSLNFLNAHTICSSDVIQNKLVVFLEQGRVIGIYGYGFEGAEFNDFDACRVMNEL